MCVRYCALKSGGRTWSFVIVRDDTVGVSKAVSMMSVVQPERQFSHCGRFPGMLYYLASGNRTRAGRVISERANHCTTAPGTGLVRPGLELGQPAAALGELYSLKSQVVLLQTAHSWANAGVLLGARMHREWVAFETIKVSG